MLQFCDKCSLRRYLFFGRGGWDGGTSVFAAYLRNCFVVFL